MFVKWCFIALSDVNQMTLQYFINHNLEKGWFVSMAPIITANCKAYEPKYLDGAGRWWNWVNLQTRLTASEYVGAALRKRSASG